MEKELFKLLNAAFTNQKVVYQDTTFSAQDVNEAAIKKICETVGLTGNVNVRSIRPYEGLVFALLEEALDEIVPATIKDVLGEFAEVKEFDVNDEAIFELNKLGKSRAKLVVSKGSREGIYRAARLSSATMKLPTHTETAAVFISLEEVLLGAVTLNEMFNTIVEAFQEEIYKQVFEALASGTPAAGYARIGEAGGGKVLATKATLGEALDAIMPYVKAYGQPTIIGSYQALSGLYNPVATTTTGGVVIQYPTREDNEDIRKIGHVTMYKGAQVVELPNYLLDNSNTKWFYDVDKVFVMPTGVKPVKIAFKGDTMIQKNLNAVGGEKWEIFRTMGVGLAMANNYAVINVTDAAIDGLEDVDFTD
jgi:hypothetical protein